MNIEKYQIFRIENVKRINKNAETIYEIIRNKFDFSIALAEVRGENTAHYHLKTTEIYHIVDGNCTLILNGERISMNTNDTIIIYPKTIHQIKSKYVKVLVIAFPPFSEKDYFEIKK
ncbi:MAG: cupin domain-containing protein [Candidatus Asgardarchaeia archaeon]